MSSALQKWILAEIRRLDLSVTRLQRKGQQIQAAHQRGRISALADVAEQLGGDVASHDTPPGLATAWAAAQQGEASRAAAFTASQQGEASRASALHATQSARGIW